MRWTNLAALALTTCACAVAAAPAGGAPARSCPYTNAASAPWTVQFVRATGDTCETARALAHRIQDSVTARRVFPTHVAAGGGRYDCTYRQRVGEPAPSAFVRCVRPARLVTMRLLRTAVGR